MGKKTEVEFIGDEIKVSVTDGTIVLTQTILPEMVKEVEKDFGVPSDAAVKFLVTYISCSLRNVGNDAAAQAEMMEEITKGIKADEVWILGYLKAFCKEILPAVVVEAGKAKAAGQDRATAVSIAFGVPIEAATAFVASSELMNQGLNDTQIAEIFIAGIKGESAEDIMKRYGLSDEKPEGA